MRWTVRAGNAALAGLIAVGVFAGANAAQAQNDAAQATGSAQATDAAPAADAAQATDAAAPTGPEAEKFAELFTQWKDLLAQLRELRLEYKTTQPAERQAIVDKYNALVGQGETLEPQLRDAAIAAFEANPAAHADAAKFVGAMAQDALARDDYPTALRLADILIAGGFGAKNATIYNIDGVAAYNLGDLDKAEASLKMARDNAAADVMSQQLLDGLPAHRQKWQKEQEIRAKEAEADDLPRVKIETSQGDVTVELFENEAPNAVANFISLVEKGFYNGTPFHRVLPGFMAQGGDPTGTGGGGPGYTIACECYDDDARMHFMGTLSMAHAGRDTGGSQFFLTFAPTQHLDGKHTVFGRIIEGLDVLPKLQRRNPDDQQPPEPDKIIKATVERKRDHDYTPTTQPGR